MFLLSSYIPRVTYILEKKNDQCYRRKVYSERFDIRKMKKATLRMRLRIQESKRRQLLTFKATVVKGVEFTVNLARKVRIKSTGQIRRRQ